MIKLPRIKATLTLTFLLLASGVFAGDIDKAFKALTSGDYTNALKFLREVLSEQTDNAAANYGMARFYSFKDNKSYDLDSANYYILKAAKKIPINPEEKEGKKFLALGVRDYTIQTLQKEINFEAYSAAEKANTLESYQHFLDLYTDPPLRENATNFRNQKAYMRAMSAQTPEAMEEFIKKYPEAAELNDAKAKYEKLVYERMTHDKTYESYKRYLDERPNGAYVKEARELYNEKLLEHYKQKNTLTAYIDFTNKYKDHPAYNSIQDTVYQLYTSDNSVEAYTNFVRNFKDNRNIKEAWEQLYVLYNVDASEAVYRKFLDEYPDYPDKDRVYADLELAKKELHPFSRDGKWGFGFQPAGDSINISIGFEYEEAYDFKNGLAAVRSKPCTEQKCIYYYINKANKRAFLPEFNFAGDFESGRAIVGTGNCETGDCQYGIIDKRGKFIVPAIYEELDDASEGLYMVAKDDKYGFINSKGDVVISLKYTDALPFKEGLAAVAIDGNWFFIDKTGAQKFISRFHDVSSFSEGLCAATQDGENWGYIDMTGNFVIEAIYESAEDFDLGYGIVSKKEKDPKNKAMTISQRYKVDKTGKVIEKLTAPKPEPKKSTKRKGRK